MIAEDAPVPHKGFSNWEQRDQAGHDSTKEAADLALQAVDEINRLHAEICEAARTTIEKAIRIGELLTEQKASLKHGEWLPWLKENVGFSRQTADNYRRLYEKRDDLKLLNVGNLTEAYQLLSEPKGYVLTEADCDLILFKLWKLESRLEALEDAFLIEHTVTAEEVNKELLAIKAEYESLWPILRELLDRPEPTYSEYVLGIERCALAVAKIRDKHLYRPNPYASFTDYCADWWRMSESRVNNFVEATLSEAKTDEQRRTGAL